MGETSDREDRDAILSMRMDAMLHSSPASFLSFVGAVFEVYVYWSPSTATILLVWSGCIAAIACTNLAAAFLYARGIPSRWTARSWARFVCVMHLLSGLAWGIGGGWMLSLANEHQALLTLSIGLAAVTVSIPSVVHLAAYNLFQLPIFWCYAVGLLASSLQFGWMIATGFFILGAFSILLGRGLGAKISSALHLSIENKRLAQRLEERGVALEAANRALEIESHTDPLTSVANRRGLMSFARSARGRCAMMVIDIDHFKSYNDAFGHVDGDACLVEVAGALRGSIRPQHDLVARLGGEEFAVFLAGISAQEASATAEAIRANVQALQGSGSRRVRRQVTVSVGLSTRGLEQRKSLATLIEEADAAVYRAKAGGRNQVCVADAAPNRHVA